MSEITQYSKDWFNKQKTGAFNSAEIILPIVIDLVSPKSVVDIGCGVGMWLSVLYKKGITDILGIDGKWIDESQLNIPKELFRAEDIDKPFNVGRTADLAMSLEVGEHLPENTSSQLIKTLTDTAPVVLFSAAIPNQPGTKHINCQWPDFWANLFKQYGFIPVDVIRPAVWTNPNVEYWYAQNTIVYVKENLLDNYPKLKEKVLAGFSTALPLVHPTRYMYALIPPPSITFRTVRKIRSIMNRIVG